jgi:hypothetical protein
VPLLAVHHDALWNRSSPWIRRRCRLRSRHVGPTPSPSAGASPYRPYANHRSIVSAKGPDTPSMILSSSRQARLEGPRALSHCFHGTHA